MSRSSDRRRAAALALVAAAVAAASFALQAATESMAPTKPRFGFGKPATPEEIAGWDIDVRPDGTGLPPGRGTVARGQVVYDEKCASCHGTFGESNSYMVLAGGVGTLASGQPVRTTGSKLNYATTLWDYINRAMPFNAPKTLTVEEVYALTAYVLHLNDLLPADASLDRERLIAFRMPNRDGFTQDHGFGTRLGKPDTRNTACMKDCATTIRLSSEYPAYALDSHGNLAEQLRELGPLEGLQTVKPAPVAEAAAKAPDGERLAKANGCTACHGTANKIVGPAFRDVAAKYATMEGAEATLVARIRQGGSGNWGQVPMPPQPQVGDDDVASIVRWILGGAR